MIIFELAKVSSLVGDGEGGGIGTFGSRANAQSVCLLFPFEPAVVGVVDAEKPGTAK